MESFLPWPTLARVAKALQSPKDHLAFPPWWFCGWCGWHSWLAGMRGCEAWCPAKSHNVALMTPATARLLGFSGLIHGSLASLHGLRSFAVT